MIQSRSMRKLENSYMMGYPLYDYTVNSMANSLTRLKLDNKVPKEVPRMSLHEAVRSDNLKMAEILLKQKEDVNKRDACKMMPLHLAVNNRSYEMVELLLRHGALVNPKRLSPESKAPLFLAVEQNSIEIALLLLNNGALVKKAVTVSNSVFDIAKKNRNKPLSKLLVEFSMKELGAVCRLGRRSKWSKKLPTKKEDSLLVYVLKKNTQTVAEKYGLIKGSPVPRSK